VIPVFTTMCTNEKNEFLKSLTILKHPLKKLNLFNVPMDGLRVFITVIKGEFTI
jgi:hypothetical protein